MIDREKVIAELQEYHDREWTDERMDGLRERNIRKQVTGDALALLKEQEAKQYNSHEVACIIADLFGDPCACNFNDIDTWLPYKCDFRETCCPNPVGVACWEQYLKHKEGR